jgi:hypothetical protein
MHSTSFLRTKRFGLLILGSTFLTTLACSAIPLFRPNSTVTPTSTPTFTPTVTTIKAPTSTPTQIYGDWRLIFRDPMDSNTRGWWTGSSNGDIANILVSFSDGKYRSDVTTTTDSGYIFWVKAPSDPLDDCYVSVEAKKNSETTNVKYGLTLRISDSGFYAFLIDPDAKKYTFFLVNNGVWDTLVEITGSEAILSGSVNTLAVKAEGSSFSLFINGQFIRQVDDGILSSGNVGLAITIPANSHTIFDFDNYELRAP